MLDGLQLVRRCGLFRLFAIDLYEDVFSLVPFLLHISIPGAVKCQSNLGDIRQLRFHILPRSFLWICTDSIVCAFASVLQDGTSLFL